MKYANLEGIGPKLSRLVYGTPVCVTQDFSEATLDAYDLAWEKGFRVLDTANSYGKGEENLGRWLARHGHRDELVILDKGCNPGQNGSKDVFSAETIRTQVKMSLERLQTEYVDMYILHRDDEHRPIEEIVDVLNALKNEGKIRRFGGSNYRQYRIEAANAYAKAHGMEGFTLLSPNYCLARLVTDPWGGSVTISGEENQGYRDWLEKTQMPVFPYSSVGRGFLSGKYNTKAGKPIEECIAQGPIWEYYAPENVQRLARAEEMAEQKGASVPQIALAWLLNQKMNIFPITCPTTLRHMEDTLKSLEITLTEEEMQWLYNG